MGIFCCLMASRVGFWFSHLLCRKESTSTFILKCRNMLTWCEQWLPKNYPRNREAPCAFFLGPKFFCQLWSENLVEFSLCWMLPLIRVIVKLNIGTAIPLSLAGLFRWIWRLSCVVVKVQWTLCLKEKETFSFLRESHYKSINEF